MVFKGKTAREKLQTPSRKAQQWNSISQTDRWAQQHTTGRPGRISRNKLETNTDYTTLSISLWETLPYRLHCTTRKISALYRSFAAATWKQTCTRATERWKIITIWDIKGKRRDRRKEIGPSQGDGDDDDGNRPVSQFARYSNEMTNWKMPAVQCIIYR